MLDDARRIKDYTWLKHPLVGWAYSGSLSLDMHVLCAPRLLWMCILPSSCRRTQGIIARQNIRVSSSFVAMWLLRSRYQGRLMRGEIWPGQVKGRQVLSASKKTPQCIKATFSSLHSDDSMEMRCLCGFL